MASMILPAISFVAFLAIVATSSPLFISEAAASTSLPLDVGQALKRRHLNPEYRDLLLLKAFVPLGHFWQGLHEQGSGISPELQSHLFFALNLHVKVRSHVPLLTRGASRGSSSSTSSEDSVAIGCRRSLQWKQWPLHSPLPLPPLPLPLPLSLLS